MHWSLRIYSEKYKEEELNTSAMAYIIMLNHCESKRLNVWVLWNFSPPNLNVNISRQNHRTRACMLTIQAGTNSNKDDRHTPVPKKRAEPWGIPIPDLLECKLVCDCIFNYEDVGLLENFAHASPVAVQQVLKSQGEKKQQGREGG